MDTSKILEGTAETTGLKDYLGDLLGSKMAEIDKLLSAINIEPAAGTKPVPPSSAQPTKGMVV